MAIKYPNLILFCLTCGAKLSTVALEDQSRDGRILCTYCRMSEVGRIQDRQLPRWNGWGDIVALAAICVLAWAIFYFLA